MVEQYEPLPDNPLGVDMFNFKAFKLALAEADFQRSKLREFANIGKVAENIGSRTLMWRIQLGLLVENSNEWVKQTRNMRSKYYQKQQEISIKGKATPKVDLKKFNPLAHNVDNNPWHDVGFSKDKEMRELITQDVERTCQEFDFFRTKKTKDILIAILFLWGKENPDYGYKQGMNELLAVVVIAFQAERWKLKAGTQATNFEQLTDEQINDNADLLVEFLFSEEHMIADVYAVYDRILNIGMKLLYQDNKDISQLKKELNNKSEENKRKQELFDMNNSTNRDKQRIRKQLEDAYEREKQKSLISRKSTRIYHELLQFVDNELYQHLIGNEVAPELHLTRWLRCLLSREFCIQTTLKYWDFIFSGIEQKHLDNEDTWQDCFLKPKEDPFINHDFMCLAMVLYIKEDLLESDFSCCLGLLMSFEEPDNQIDLIESAVEIRRLIYESDDPDAGIQTATNIKYKKTKEPEPVQAIVTKQEPVQSQPFEHSFSNAPVMNQSSAQSTQQQTNYSESQSFNDQKYDPLSQISYQDSQSSQFNNNSYNDNMTNAERLKARLYGTVTAARESIQQTAQNPNVQQTMQSASASMSSMLSKTKTMISEKTQQIKETMEEQRQKRAQQENISYQQQYDQYSDQQQSLVNKNQQLAEQEKLQRQAEEDARRQKQQLAEQQAAATAVKNPYAQANEQQIRKQDSSSTAAKAASTAFQQNRASVQNQQAQKQQQQTPMTSQSFANNPLQSMKGASTLQLQLSNTQLNKSNDKLKSQMQLARDKLQALMSSLESGDQSEEIKGQLKNIFNTLEYQ